MSNTRFYVDPSTTNDYFSPFEILKWNNYLKKNYRLYTYFYRIMQYKINDPRVKHYSSREVLWTVRSKHRIKCPNEISRFLAFMYNQQKQKEYFQLKK